MGLSCAGGSAPAAYFRRGDLVIVNFPFSALDGAKPRPALVAAVRPENRELVLLQITSRPPINELGLPIDSSMLEQGWMLRQSTVRPDKIFTASESIIGKRFGRVKPETLAAIDGRLKALFGFAPEPAARPEPDAGDMPSMRP